MVFNLFHVGLFHAGICFFLYQSGFKNKSCSYFFCIVKMWAQTEVSIDTHLEKTELP